MIIVALDDSKPVTREDVSSRVWAGNAKNRWYDKHQFVVFDNGKSGFLGQYECVLSQASAIETNGLFTNYPVIGEHSCMDGTPTLRMNEFVLSSIAKGDMSHQAQAETTRGNLPAPAELKFELDDKAKKYITEAEKHYDELIDAHEMNVSLFNQCSSLPPMLHIARELIGLI